MAINSILQGASTRIGGGIFADLDVDRNLFTFSSSGATTVPPWAKKMTYLIVAGGAAGSGAWPNVSGGAGGAIVQGSASVAPNVLVTVTVGGQSGASSIAVSGGSTYTASGTSAGGGGNGSSGTAGTVISAPFAIGRRGGGGGGGNVNAGYGHGGDGGGGSGGINVNNNPIVSGESGNANSGGGGGGGSNSSGGGGGGSGLVMIYFS